MPKSDKEVEMVLTAQLNASERTNGIVYLSNAIVPKTSTLQLPNITINVPWDARLAFIDGEPVANWGHVCRYVLVNQETGETLSKDARFPPFQAGRADGWRVVYRASGVPDRALLVHE